MSSTGVDPAATLARRPPEQVGPHLPAGLGLEQVGQGPERDGPGGVAGRHRDHPEPGPGGQGGALLGQAGLADARRAGARTAPTRSVRPSRSAMAASSFARPTSGQSTALGIGPPPRPPETVSPRAPTR